MQINREWQKSVSKAIMANDKKKKAVHNNTKFSIDEINAFPKIGETVNNWRQREVTLRQHPTDNNMVVSVGVTFDGMMTVISEEPRDAWATALDYIAHGKVYVSQ